MLLTTPPDTVTFIFICIVKAQYIFKYVSFYVFFGRFFRVFLKKKPVVRYPSLIFRLHLNTMKVDGI